MSSPESITAPSPDAEGSPASPERPTGNKYDQMFGSDDESTHAPNDDEDDEDAGVRKRSRRVGTNGDGAADEDAEGEEENDDKDLFGDDSDEEAPKPKELSDNELEGTPELDEQENEPEREYRSIDVSLPRHPVPNPGNDDLYLLRVPSLIAIQPQIFYPENFTLKNLATTDTMTSPYTAATTTIRVRKSPVDPNTLQSNARIIKWSDGSLSLQIASSPNLYDLTSKPLAPSHKTPEKYDPAQDSHTYLLTPHESAGMLRFLGHATHSLNVLPTGASQANAEAVNRLHEQLSAAQAARGGRRAGQPAIEITDMRDPEAERKEAERISRDKERAAKKLENQQRRARGGAGGAGEARGAGAKFPPRSTGTRSKRDSPPINVGARKSNQDEYDLEDDFVQGSDDEEVVESSEEDESDDGGRRRRPVAAAAAAGAKKRREEVVEEEEEEEDEAEFTDEERAERGRGGGRAGKRRRVVDDDDEDDE
ncbi:uncharacterized protein H6S33_000696 [Morchella sextelata]|uniref:uncharacterized protein n=1 Tax=Morchella sextelata TaxID=1174677 RepID=UPI001D0569FF|nr:uncharacterized protein H6S33_000696 [Morchella sextelata]KAH0615060.1 hypothetical protein H6S33_000696 [Morchella sextelata]